MSIRKGSRWIAVGLAGIIGAASIVTMTPVAPAQAITCEVTRLMAFRGSGETIEATKNALKDAHQISDEMGWSDFWEGPTLYRAMAAYLKKDRAMGINGAMAPISIMSGDYEAIGIPEAGRKAAKNKAVAMISGGNPNAGSIYALTLAEILRSSRTGFVAGQNIINKYNKETPAECGIPHWVLLGYSQGAMAAREIYMANGDGHAVGGIMVFGDPFQSKIEGGPKASEAAGLHGDGANNNGVFIGESIGRPSEIDVGFDKEGMDNLYRSETPRYSLCHKADPMCNYSSILGMPFLGSHLDYVTSKAESAEVGDWLAKTVQKIGNLKPIVRAPTPDIFHAYPWGEWTLTINGKNGDVNMVTGTSYNLELSGLLEGQSQTRNPDRCDAPNLTLFLDDGNGGYAASATRQSLLIDCVKWNSGDATKGEWTIRIPWGTPPGRYYVAAMSAHDGAGAIAVTVTPGVYTGKDEND